MKRTLIPKGYETACVWIGVYLVTLFLVSGIDLIPESILPETAARFVQYVFYCLMVGAWAMSSASRLYERRIKVLHFELCVAFFLILIFGCFRRVVFNGVYPWEHILWYLFYLPTLSIPLLSFYITQYIGRDGSWHLPRKAQLLIIPGLLLFLGILTNEWHEMAFILEQKGVATSLSGHYRVNWLYYLAQGWYLLFTFLSLVRLVRVYREHDLRLYILPQALVVALGILYTVLYALDRSPTGFGYVEPAIMSCTVSIGVWEASLLTGMIPNNRGHARFFNASTVPMELMDKGGSIRHVSAGHELPGHVYITRTNWFSEGSIRYREDVTELDKTLAALEEAEKTLREANRKLESDVQVRAQLARTAERNRVYDRALADTKDRIETVRATVAKEVRSRAEQSENIAYISILLAYIKRRANLVLTEEASGEMAVKELHFCLRETVEALSLIPVSVVYTQDMDETGKLSAKAVMRLYDAFEDVVEETLPHLEQMRIRLETTAEDVRIALELDGSGMEKKKLTLSSGRECDACV